jgi:hypothetical protein
MNCHICAVSIDRFNTVWLPDRAEDSSRVYPICFYCTDLFIACYQKGILSLLQSRELGT